MASAGGAYMFFGAYRRVAWRLYIGYILFVTGSVYSQAG